MTLGPDGTVDTLHCDNIGDQSSPVMCNDLRITVKDRQLGFRVWRDFHA